MSANKEPEVLEKQINELSMQLMQTEATLQGVRNIAGELMAVVSYLVKTHFNGELSILKIMLDQTRNSPEFKLHIQDSSTTRTYKTGPPLIVTSGGFTPPPPKTTM